MPDFIAYIDEAGDEGFGRLRDPDNAGGQSRWLLLGAALVRADDDPNLPKWRDEILSGLRKKCRDLHFCDLKHDQRVFVSQRIAALPVQAAVVLSHKVTIPGTPWAATFKRKGYLYNYLVRWLLERLTTHVASTGQDVRLRLVFSRRGGTDYDTMRDYLILMRDGRELIPPVRRIVWRVLDVNDIAVENHAVRAGLQFADCITSAFHKAVEPNQFGNFEPRYAESLRWSVLRDGRSALNCGVAPIPSWTRCQPDQHHRDFFMSFANDVGRPPDP